MKTYLKWFFGLMALIVLAVVCGAINTTTGTGSVMISGLILAGFTEEQSKSFNDWMEKQATDIQTKVKSLVEAAKEGELLNELKSLVKGDDKTKGLPDLITIMQKQLDDQNIEIQKGIKMKQIDEEVATLEMGLKALYKSAEFQQAKKDGFPNGKNVFQIKADTSNITGTVNMTQQNLSVKFTPERSLAFIPYLNGGVVGAEKNRVLWVEGSFTSNVGYVAEGTGQATSDTGTAVEKSRGMAKISAKLPITAEMLEDADYIASAFRMKMQEKALLFVDSEVYGGDGSDGVNPGHIYGIKGHATAYSAVVTGTSVNLVEKANIGDLVDDCILQAELSEQRGVNVLWMHPKDFARFKKAKDANGQYLFVKDVNGKYTISGLNVVKTTAVTANTMTIADSTKVQLWWKRNAELKISQMNGTDFIDDAYTAVMFLRNQVVVEAADKTALIHVADITASIAAITAEQVA